jgi:hypothetical protein
VTRWFKIWSGIAVGVLFLGVFASGLGIKSIHFGAVRQTPPPQVVKSGNYGRYLYGITDLQPANKKVAQYDPTLPPDDTVVVPALKELAGTGLGVTIADAVEPEVETIDETNYVTFTVGKEKVLFELFRNSGGQVGTVRFWEQAL